MFKSALAAAAFAGAALTLAAPASAFTLTGPTLAQPMASGQIEHVWWDRWGVWHPNAYRYAYPAYGYRYAYPYRRCWRGAYGYVHC